MGAYRGHSPNFLGVVRCLFRGGPPKKCQGAKMYPRTKFLLLTSAVQTFESHVILAATYPTKQLTPSTPLQYHENQQYLHPYISPVVTPVPLIIQRCGTGFKRVDFVKHIPSK